MEPEKLKQLEAKLKTLFEEAEKEEEPPMEPAVTPPVNRKVVIRRRNGVSMKLVS